MDFSDDDDCFCRYDQEEAFMGNEQGSFQPEEEMLPPEEEGPPVEEEMGAEVESPSESTPTRSTEGCHTDEGLGATLPVLETESSSPGSSSTAPISAAGKRRPRLNEKTVPQGDWATIQAPVPTASLQPPSVPGVIPAAAAESEWWEQKSEKKKYLHVYNMLRRSNAYDAWKLTLRKRFRERLPATWMELELEHKEQFLDWFVQSSQPVLHDVVKRWIWDSLMPKMKQGRGGHMGGPASRGAEAGKASSVDLAGSLGRCSDGEHEEDQGRFGGHRDLEAGSPRHFVVEQGQEAFRGVTC